LLDLNGPRVTKATPRAAQLNGYLARYYPCVQIPNTRKGSQFRVNIMKIRKI